jgi:hypothetical protein
MPSDCTAIRLFVPEMNSPVVLLDPIQTRMSYVYGGATTFNYRGLAAVARVASNIYSTTGALASTSFLGGAAVAAGVYSLPTALAVGSTLFAAKTVYDGLKEIF